MEAWEDLRQKFHEDAFPRYLGVELLEVAPGYARVAMTLTDNMLNFHGIGHGGAIFTLADTALGLASNSRGEKSVALTVTINYLASALAGQRLVATAREHHATRRTGIYDVTIEEEGSGKVIAIARGTSFRPQV
ncbi:MAG: hydroxyphenylacetyl-CoA thioesterase PaaI [Thermoanaerobacteraceae bacterium]|uniref:hydroxyphenylacetyl-CoA thioesterase PaaI n=1 Tax=Thermanaeromonas sp. C210 TaxID=2731925 RepID=UPI00155BF585|nr:hydroxyphenylacetyl-CoA thioesterase PaaI [Thermanaeromonas sp. C210]MBE3581076.1 hydroxyphenylacetyl-CoA thioesterase PaaI [Thermoanaerobacteraceae bacterium]GFN22662.1 phenylacetic acid degradation protein PaaD [Thermanaeromonas sp. C210]